MKWTLLAAPSQEERTSNGAPKRTSGASGPLLVPDQPDGSLLTSKTKS